MRVVAAMSGGVDSSVAAFVLKQKGFDVIGVTIKTWPKEECGATGEKLCCSLESIQFARSVAEDMDIPHYVVDLSKEFTEEVKDYFVEEYTQGRTPNPCIYCNSRIKFGYLFRKAKELGAERIATGHYARILNKDGKHCLAESKDKWRDQSYFLYDVDKDVLPFVDFPLGEYSKEEVRNIAMQENLTTAMRQASQDICFAAAEGDYRKYLIGLGVDAFTPGDIVDVTGKVVGTHKGIASYTVGQRHGLGEVKLVGPLYVLKIDTDSNTIMVGKREHAMSSKIRVAGFNWLSVDKFSGARKFDAKIRYHGKKASALLTPWGDDEAILEFDQPQFAPTPGQAAVFYDDEVVAGGAWIEETLA